MNLHPIFVHFPIALLSVYALMELVRWRKITSQPYWFYLKAVFLMLGGLGALAAVYTGSMAKAAVRSGEFYPAIANFNQVVRMHENFADLSVAIFGILAAAYLVMWFERAGFASFAQKNNIGGFWKGLVSVAKFFAESWFTIAMALIGLVCITITGGLGGVIVYGPTADPFFAVIYRMMFPGQ